MRAWAIVIKSSLSMNIRFQEVEFANHIAFVFRMAVWQEEFIIVVNMNLGLRWLIHSAGVIRVLSLALH